MNRLLIAVILLTLQVAVEAFPQAAKTQAARGTGNNMFPQWSHDGKRVARSS
jgi:Tol biopolymer transport system component